MRGVYSGPGLKRLRRAVMLRRGSRRRANMIVGQRVRRPDAPDKVKGTALYIEDMAVPGALTAAVLRSPEASARIVRLDVRRARTTQGVAAVLTAADIPGKNLI